MFRRCPPSGIPAAAGRSYGSGAADVRGLHIYPGQQYLADATCAWSARRCSCEAQSLRSWICAKARAFAGGLAKINGQLVAMLELSGTVKVQVIRAVVVSAFEVETRGRLVTVQIDGQQLMLKGDFVQINKASPA